MDAVQLEIFQWANATFPNREFKTTLAKLVLEEIPEWMQNPDDAMEFADLVILIFDLASMKGINIADAVLEKMTINREREWEKDTTGLFYRHKK
jgi:predicted house-cleaning noncanonical NTP pyrophosphatase (MazG superfamily)